MFTIGSKGIALIKKYEGLRLAAYRCPAGVPTLGYGSTSGIRMGMTCTESQAEQMLRKDLVRFEAAVNRLVKVKITQNMFDALCSFAFNLGEANLANSTLLRLLNAGDFKGASAQFERWNKAAGKVLKGLTLRRQAEAALFLS